MFCVSCGQRLPEDASFCSKCGRQLETNLSTNSVQKTEVHQEKPLTRFIQAKCSNCGAHLVIENSNSTAFCSSCGTPYIISSNTQSEINKLSDFKVVGGELLAYKGASRNVIIPDNVSVIGKQAFQGLAITSVYIPDSVVRIRENAFADCVLLKEIRIPSSVEYINEYAFAHNVDLRIVWPSTWEKRESTRLHVVSCSLDRELYVFIKSEYLKYDHKPLSFFYCGRGRFSYFSETKSYFEYNTRQDSAFNDFDVKDFDIQVMYKELVLLFERSGLSIDKIELVEVPTFGWHPVGNQYNFKAKNGKIQLYKVSFIDDPYDEDH